MWYSVITISLRQNLKCFYFNDVPIFVPTKLRRTTRYHITSTLFSDTKSRDALVYNLLGRKSETLQTAAPLIHIIFFMTIGSNEYVDIPKASTFARWTENNIYILGDFIARPHSHVPKGSHM